MTKFNRPNYYVVITYKHCAYNYELWSWRSGGKVAGDLTKEEAYKLEDDMNEADKKYNPLSFE